MRQPLIASAVLHVALIALIVLGLPPSDRKLDIPPSIPIEIVDIGEVTEAARVDKGEPKPQAPRPPVPEAKPTPPAPEPDAEPPPPPPPPPKAPEPPKLAQLPPPPREPEPPKPEPPPPPPPPAPTPEPAPIPPRPPKPEPPKPEPPKPEPPKPEPPKPEPPKPTPPKPEPHKPEPPKPEPPKPEPPKPQTQAKPKPEPPKPEPPKKEPTSQPNALAALINNVSKLRPSDNPKADGKAQPHSAPAPSGAQKATSGPQRDFKPTGQAIERIRNQVSKNWNFDPGRKDAGNMRVELRIEVAADGTVLRTELSEETKRRALSDSHFRAAAESAMRAINRSQKLDLDPKEFTPETYEKWRTIVFAFDPKDMF